MARKIFSFRLDEDLVSRIDGTGLKRSDFVRGAIEAALCGSVVPEPVSAPEPTPAAVAALEPAVVSTSVPKKNNSGVSSDGFRVDAFRSDSLVLLEALRKKRMTPRDAERAMGWLGLRYSRAEAELLGAGVICLDDGFLVLV